MRWLRIGCLAYLQAADAPDGCAPNWLGETVGWAVVQTNEESDDGSCEIDDQLLLATCGDSFDECTDALSAAGSGGREASDCPPTYFGEEVGFVNVMTYNRTTFQCEIVMGLLSSLCNQTNVATAVAELEASPCLIGCTDPIALNYNPTAQVSMGCEYACGSCDLLSHDACIECDDLGECGWDFAADPGTCGFPSDSGFDLVTQGVHATCAAWLADGFTQSGLYRVRLVPDGDAVVVYCDMEADGGGWMLTLISRNGVGDGQGNQWFPSVGNGNGGTENFPKAIAMPVGNVGSGRAIGPDRSTRGIAFQQIAGTSVRGTRYSADGDIQQDEVYRGISAGSLQTSPYNGLHCFATGCNGNNWPHNGWNGNVDVIGGSQADAFVGAVNQGFQDIGDWTCNCCEWIGCLNQGHCIAGDGECGPSYLEGTFAAFWIR